jgi:hypothetical protein
MNHSPIRSILPSAPSIDSPWRVIVVGGHTRSIGKTQLVCDLIGAFPNAHWIAGKITQYGHGICARNGHECDCAPDEHVCALNWEHDETTGTDSARFLAAGAQASFWLRTKQGFLAEGMPLLRAALTEQENRFSDAPRNLILESNTLLQFWQPALYLLVIDPAKSDFKPSARLYLDRASALVLRQPIAQASSDPELGDSWADVPRSILRGKPQFVQELGQPLPPQLLATVAAALKSTDFSRHRPSNQRHLTD